MGLTKLQKIILVPILILVLLGPIFTPFAESFNFPDRYDLVAVLVEQGLYADSADYEGLAGKADGPIERTNIKSRVDRYAIDLQNALPGTRAVIIQVDRFEKPENVAAVLERLYFEGDPKEKNRIAYLRGVVVVGEVPLPVIDKSGNRFISMFPYADFEQKAYVFNPQSQNFEISSENASPQPEIWHGVIRPPVSTQIPDGKQLIAAYFDKNHLYHIGDAVYSTFAKRVFFQDLFQEKKNLNPTAYKMYQNFLDHQDDVSYMRYTKELYDDLSGGANESVANDLGDAKALQEEMAALGIPMDSSIPPMAGAPAVQPGAVTNPAATPDIMTKIAKMSDGLLLTFDQVFTKYPSLINDFIKYTGRYITTTEDANQFHVDSAVNLIPAKDAFTIGYLKAVNTMVESKVDEIVNTIQRPIPLITEGNIEVKSVLHKPIINPLNLLPDPRDLEDHEVTTSRAGVTSTPSFFTNFSPAMAKGGGLLGDEQKFADESIFGRPFAQVTGVEQCSFYRGSNGEGDYSKMVEANHAFNEQSGREADSTKNDTLQAWESRCDSLNGLGLDDFQVKNCVGFALHAGCFYSPAPYDYDNPGKNWCFPIRAMEPVIDIAGTRAVDSAPAGSDDFHSCFQFNEKTKLATQLPVIDSFLRTLDDDKSTTEQRLAKARQAAMTDFNVDPNSFTLFRSDIPGDTYSITLGQVLRLLGANMNGGAWKTKLTDLFMNDLGPATLTVPIDSDYLKTATIGINRTVDHYIPSTFFHKEPTIETLHEQVKNMISRDLPVDNPRYVTFQNQNGQTSKIVYPDLFAQPTLDAYVTSLRQLEDQINAVPRRAGMAAPCANCLTGLVSDLSEISSNQRGKDTTISRANRSKVLDALNWKNMDIDTKHKYLTEYYLDPLKNAYIGESLNGYELAYFNGEGFSDKYEFSMNVSEGEGANGEGGAGGAGAGGAQIAQEKDEPYDDDPNNPFDNPAAERDAAQVAGGGYDLFSWTPPPVSPWWERMKEWMDETKETLQDFSFGLGEQAFYGQLDEENKKSLEAIKKEASEAEGLFSGVGDMPASRIARVDLVADSNVIASGKKAAVKLTIKDKDNADIKDEFAKITLEITGGTFAKAMKDEDGERPGTQITVMSGILNVEVLASETEQSLKLTARADDLENSSSLEFRIVKDARLDVTVAGNAAAVPSVSSNGSTVLTLNITAQDSNAQVIAGMNGEVSVGISDPSMGKVVDEKVRMQGGRGQVRYISGTKAGRASINASSNSLNPGSLQLNLLPGLPVKIGMSASPETLEMSAGAHVIVTATLFDANGNTVNTASGTPVDFKLVNGTEKFGALSSASERTINGVATASVSPRDQAGEMVVEASSVGIGTSQITIKSVTQFGRLNLLQMQPETLTAALLGIPAGDVSEPDFLGGWFTMNGKTQAAVSLTTQPKQSKKLFEVSDTGALHISDTSRISTGFAPANNFSLILRDNFLQKDLAQMSLFTFKEGQFDFTEATDPDALADGIYVRKLSKDEAYQIDKTKGSLRIAKAQSEKFEVQTNGYMRIFDNDFSIKPRDGKFLILQVLDKDTPVAEVFFVQRFSQDVRVQEEISEAPGVYVKKLYASPQIFAGKSFSGNSSNNPRGLAFFDKSQEGDPAGAPGFGFLSLEDSLDRPGVGFTQDNKFALLFAAGEMFGEANRSYASDAGIVLGDPTVKINNTKNGTFSTDIGKLAYAASADVRGIISLDYNNDGFEDILVVQGDGKIRLLQNNGGIDQLKDQGFILDIQNGIQDIGKVDYNNDGQMDLIIAGKNSCRQGETCVDIFENQRSAFVRKNLKFDQKEEIVSLATYDLNNDGFSDIIFADAAGDIKVFYNKGGSFDGSLQTVGNVGLQIDSAKNLIQSVLLRYPGMDTKNKNDPDSVQSYKSLTMKESNPQTQQGMAGFFPAGASAQIDQGFKYTEKDFIYADRDGSMQTSTKFSQDLNGGVMKSGDRVRYTITLNNTAGAAKNGLMLSDIVAETLQIDEASIACVDCGANKIEIEKMTNESTRPYLFKNINIPAFSSRRIVYEAVFAGGNETAEKVIFGFNNKFADSDARISAALTKDSYADISVTKEGNTSGQVRYFYTTAIDRNKVLSWETALSSSAQKTVEDLEALTGLDFPNPDDIQDSAPVECTVTREAIPPFPATTETITTNSKKECLAQNGTVGKVVGAPRAASGKLADITDKDSDGDGLQDSVDGVNGFLDDAAVATQAAVSKLTCDAGCIALPANAAFFTPGFFNVLGIPTSYDIGLPVFGWGAPSIPPTWPPAPALTTAGGRFYVSPSLTGGVGFSLCLGTFSTPLGPPPMGNCFSFGVNPLDLLPGNICDKLNSATSAAMSKANSLVSDAKGGLTMAVGKASGGTVNANSRESSGSGMMSYSLGSYDAPVSKSKNIRIPGFPSIIADWWAAQVEEITDKVLSIPDIYLIYPDGDSIMGSFKPSQEFARTGDLLTNVLSYINSVPLIDIETQQVLFKVPAITRKEIERFKADARQWIIDERLELDRWRNIMGCVGIPAVGFSASGNTGKDAHATPSTNALNLDLCKIVTADMNKFINSVVQNMQALDEWILFPKKILQYRTIESYYVSQIIDYLDTIIQFTGGWTKRNIARVAAWRKAVREMKEVVEKWKFMLNLMIDYNESCDKCKTERYSLKDLVMKLFIALPSPPVIPMPKLPDFVIDVSKVQAGIKILWPDVQFKPDPITLPRLPRIKLGVNLDIPMFKLMVPAIPVIQSPPQLPTLPALPPLKIGKLPDIPPAPTLPKFPRELTITIDFLKKIMKILCILKMGFMPTTESMLKTRIEEITARGLSPLIPIDLLFTVQTPTISVTYVDLIKITAFTTLKLDLNYVQKAVEEVAAKANSYTTGIASKINQFTDNLTKEIEKYTSPTINLNKDGAKLNYKEPLKEKLDLSSNLGREALNRELSQAFGTDVSDLVDAGLQFRESLFALDERRKLQEEEIAQIPERLVMNVEEESLADAKKSIVAYDDTYLPTAFQKNLKEYRDELAMHVANSQFNADQINDLGRFLADQKSPFEEGGFKKYVAATNLESIKNNSNGEPVKVGQFDTENISWMPAEDAVPAEDLSDGRLLAQIPGLPAIPGMPGEGGPTGDGQIQDVGLFYDDGSGEGSRLINYTLEADSETHLADIDIDNDDDIDKIYSYGRNVYIKTSAQEMPQEERKIFRPVDVEIWTVYELLPPSGSLNFPKAVNQTAHEVNFETAKSVSADIAGFEVIAKNSPDYFERPTIHHTTRAHFIKTPQAATASAEMKIALIEPDGAVTVNDVVPTQNSAQIGDRFRTGKDSSVTLKADDGTIIKVDEKSLFTLSNSGVFELEMGNVEIDLPEVGAIFKGGTTFRTAENSEIRIKLFDGSNFNVGKNSSLALPTMQPIYASLSVAPGSALFTGQKRDFVNSGSGKIHVAAGEIIHPLEITKLTWDASGSEAQTFSISNEIMIPVPDSFASGIDIEVNRGFVEIIRSAKATQPVAAGMALTFGDKIEVNTGSVNVRYRIGGSTTVYANETYSLNEANIDSPTFKLALDPAFYFTKIYSFDSAGKRSVASEKLLLSPQVCGDDTPPLANAGKQKFQLAVGKTLDISASRSFDTEGSITAYWLDTDTSTDSSGDGIANNDRDIWKDKDTAIDQDGDLDPADDADSPILQIGPYEKIGTKNMRLIVRDEALNEGYQDIVVEVVTPRIVLDGPPLRSNIISGYVEPAEDKVPITIARLRPGQGSTGWEILKTPSADANLQYFTNADGKFSIKDADLRDRLVVRDGTGKAIAEIDNKTGSIKILDDRYETRFLLASPPDLPARTGVFLKTDATNNNPLTFVYFVPDVNTDTTIDPPSVVYDAGTAASVSGVHVKPLEAATRLGISFRILPGSDPALPGATEVLKGNARLATIDVDGSVVIVDKAIEVRQKSVDLQKNPDAPVVLEMTYNGDVIAEILIAISGSTANGVEIVGTATPPARPRPTPTPKPKPAKAIPKKQETQPFTDIPEGDSFGQIAERLFQRKIIAGYPSNVKGELLYKPENLINRAEFTQIALKMLCIVPREEARKLPSPFYDVLDPKSWFYPTLKEGNIRGFIKGYLGEKKTDPKTGQEQSPFKPANNITRAEAATVVIAALWEENIIDLSKYSFQWPQGGQWYDPYIEIAKDLKPYLVNPADSARTFLLTKEEAAKPNELISRKDFAVMADRVLLIYDCFNPDSDDDGLLDDWEQKTGKPLDQVNPQEDPDKDGCNNLKEYELGTDPFDADTDGDSSADCEEANNGKDPLDPSDGPPPPTVIDIPALPADKIKKNEEGVYVLRPECGQVCPCRATIGPGGDLQLGDIIFAAITGPNGLPIYAKSNEEKY